MTFTPRVPHHSVPSMQTSNSDSVDRTGILTRSARSRSRHAMQGDPGGSQEPLFGTASRLAAQRLADSERARRIAAIGRALHLPARDEQIQAELRALNEPECFESEDAHDRRERLRYALALKAFTVESSDFGGSASDKDGAGQAGIESPPAHKKSKPFTALPVEVESFASADTAIASELRAVRQRILSSSLRASHARLRREHREYTESSPETRLAQRATSTNCIEHAAGLRLHQSRHAHERPTSQTRLVRATHAAGGSEYMLISASYGGDLALWSPYTGQQIGQRVHVHTSRVTGLEYSSEHGLVASCSSDGSACVWTLDVDTGLQRRQDLSVHGTEATHGRPALLDIVLHPHVPLALVACAGANTWRAHNIERPDEATFLYEQSGHAHHVTALACHPDGSLIVSGGADGALLLWDLRSGKNIARFEGVHSEPITSVDFDPRGTHFASGAKDNLVKIFDVRKLRWYHTLAAHPSVISCVRYQPAPGHEGGTLISSSFDRTCRVFASRRGCVQVNSLDAHLDKVTSCDISEDGTMVVTGCYDKSWKVWTGADAQRGSWGPSMSLKPEKLR
ncbi:putative WD repeat-containing protein [Porphyridium purpureum]|uniref:Putative WD repeat-containing protein n=1 Tax=Porphyridium purpureum TaxID=35688 RepID=A0A5J4YFR8_PORPP|nr:putative WD repeat-containing protein [Porphyridium purpureum]|eukprot:POR1506..scf257_31